MNKFRMLTGILVALPLTLAAQVSFAGGDADNGAELAKSKACEGCHAADGNSTMGMNPILAGQYESYLIHALKDYRSGARKNAIMGGMVESLTDQEIKDLAAWFSSQESALKVVD